MEKGKNIHLRPQGEVSEEEYGCSSLVELIPTTREPQHKDSYRNRILPDYDREEQIGRQEIRRIIDSEARSERSYLKRENIPLCRYNLTRSTSTWSAWRDGATLVIFI